MADNDGQDDDTSSDNVYPTPSEKEAISLSRLTVYHSAEDLSSAQSTDKLADAVVDGVDEASFLVKEWNNVTASPGDGFKPYETKFNDGKVRTVDFVMVWTNGKSSPSKDGSVADNKRQVFIKNLKLAGLLIEVEENSKSNINFVLIHAPEEVLCRYAEIMKLRMPIVMKESSDPDGVNEPSFDLMLEVKSFVNKTVDRCLNFVNVDPKIFKPTPHKLTAEFCRDKDYLFDVKDENFFPSSIRILVIDFILERNKFTEDSEQNPFAFGIQRLIADKTYEAAYPLHDGKYKAVGGDDAERNLRNLLYEEWASLHKWINHQPIDHIKDYFGVKFGLYFAWLGFYTHMLIPAAIVGLICFLYGVCTLYYNTLSEDICNLELNITMCPLCDGKCDYWNLAETCSYARITYLFDNPATVIFAVFMSFWCTMFLELWKRYSAGITHRWGLTGFDLQAEHPRPEYLARLANVKEYKTNPVTKVREPYVPFWRVRVPYTVLSFSVVLLLIMVAVVAVFGVVLYRMSVLASTRFFGIADNTSYLIIFIPATAATINLVCIMLLNWFYDWLAVKLTELELLRTQTQFEDSLTLKIYLFQFVNYYVSIFYIAFLKGKFVGYPAKYNRIFKLRQEECSPGGCLMELCIQLSIIMVGKQALNSILELVIPWCWKFLNTLRTKNKDDSEQREVAHNQWSQDYRLVDWGPRGLFPEYLEMVLQYGFVTIFVAAFPLAPLFALINNVLEMRLDAKKFLTFYRRPVTRRVKDLGVWFQILDVLGRISVVTNALIIAFASNFIPQLVYRVIVSPDHTDIGYLNHSLAYFNTKDFQENAAPENSIYVNVTTCRYAEYRNPPWHERPYKRPHIYWHILAARLAFIVVFQNVVGFVTLTIQGLIPDVPGELRDQIRREAYLTNEVIIQKETERAKIAAVLNSPNLIAAERGDNRKNMKVRIRDPRDGDQGFQIV